MKSKSHFLTLEFFDTLPDSANVRLPIVMALYGVSSATVWRNIKNGNIPKPRKLTSRTTVFNVGDLRNALTSNQIINKEVM